jgi:hypothetical protein
MSHKGTAGRLHETLERKLHRSSYSLGESAANCLYPPALRIVDDARLPENDRGNDPGPEELPKYTGPTEYLLDITE